MPRYNGTTSRRRRLSASQRKRRRLEAARRDAAINARQTRPRWTRQ